VSEFIKDGKKTAPAPVPLEKETKQASLAKGRQTYTPIEKAMLIKYFLRDGKIELRSERVLEVCEFEPAMRQLYRRELKKRLSEKKVLDSFRSCITAHIKLEQKGAAALLHDSGSEKEGEE